MRVIASELGRIEAKMVQEMEGTVIKCGKGLVLSKVFAQEIFTLKPAGLDRLLMGGLRGQRPTNHWPVLFLKSVVNLGEQRSELTVPMISGAVPYQNKPLSGRAVP
jgi:hypothetical protein